jgi:sortase A
MKDHRYVDELSLEELEALVRLRRRQRRQALLEGAPRATDPLSGVVSGGGTGPVTGTPERSYWRAAATSEEAASRYSAVVEAPQRSREKRPIRWRWLRDQALLLVEILAVLGLFWVVTRMVGTVERVNEESRELQSPPTAVATPMIGVFVLPGGHAPPQEDRQPEPEPIPVHLRGLVAAVTPLPIPTLGAEHAVRITIPALGVDAPVVSGDDWESLKKGAGHHVGSANPGERGNCVISGHNDIYGEVFRGLPDLAVGDEIIVQTLSATHRYLVQQTRIVEPTDISVMDGTSTPVLTLVSCYPYRVDTQRIVIIASLAAD